MWSFVKNLFVSIFQGPQSIPPPCAAGAPIDPELAFKNYDDEFYDDHVIQPDKLTAQIDVVTMDQKVIQEKFLEIIKYYNDVVMTNTIVFSEKEVLNYQKKIFKLEQERKKFVTADSTTSIDIDGDFFKYILKKIENIQSTLGAYNKQLSFFYIKYKKRYDWFSILIIILSSSLSLMEGITLCFSNENVISTIISLVTSTSIAVLTSVLKFKNYKEKLEEVVKTKEKIHNCQAKVFTFDKELKTTIFLNNNSNNEQRDIVHRGPYV